MKRLDVWLPYNHPIWSVPPGARSAVAREWLDIGERLKAIEDRIDHIQPKQDQREEEKGNKSMDVAKYAKNLKEVFDL